MHTYALFFRRYKREAARLSQLESLEEELMKHLQQQSRRDERDVLLAVPTAAFVGIFVIWIAWQSAELSGPQAYFLVVMGAFLVFYAIFALVYLLPKMRRESKEICMEELE